MAAAKIQRTIYNFGLHLKNILANLSKNWNFIFPLKPFTFAYSNTDSISSLIMDRICPSILVPLIVRHFFFILDDLRINPIGTSKILKILKTDDLQLIIIKFCSYRSQKNDLPRPISTKPE